MSDIVVIRCRENGPLVVQGPFRLVDHLGNEFVLPADKPAVALCRCGASGKKPFCDGSHRECGFQGGQPAPARLPPA
jgi:CDGSH-type Zn-finger protein